MEPIRTNCLIPKTSEHDDGKERDFCRLEVFNPLNQVKHAAWTSSSKNKNQLLMQKHYQGA